MDLILGSSEVATFMEFITENPELDFAVVIALFTVAGFEADVFSVDSDFTAVV